MNRATLGEQAANLRARMKTYPVKSRTTTYTYVGPSLACFDRLREEFRFDKVEVFIDWDELQTKLLQQCPTSALILLDPSKKVSLYGLHLPQETRSVHVDGGPTAEPFVTFTSPFRANNKTNINVSFKAVRFCMHTCHQSTVEGNVSVIHDKHSRQIQHPSNVVKAPVVVPACVVSGLTCGHLVATGLGHGVLCKVIAAVPLLAALPVGVPTGVVGVAVGLLACTGGYLYERCRTPAVDPEQHKAIEAASTSQDATNCSPTTDQSGLSTPAIHEKLD
eukprot:TRINITY_DN20872_c0_g1_i1.p1 TRINITY_DN20872_c0_g1~~TRINITY_DN20872_c0_g1_i1.p1  ORF type:complete len:325 (-),score=25.01 TRINITY_DN20872_c0_g1_i1:276-1106(-)